MRNLTSVTNIIRIVRKNNLLPPNVLVKLMSYIFNNPNLHQYHYYNSSFLCVSMSYILC